jgi:IS1 family transposase
MTMASRIPRQIVNFAVNFHRPLEMFQRIVDNAPPAREYCTDGFKEYLGVIFPGKHTRNIHDKCDTYIVEGINADLRHYIPGLARRSRCFFRTLETLQAVFSVFVDAYNKFGDAKQKYHVRVQHKSPFGNHLHEFRDLPFSFLDYL